MVAKALDRQCDHTHEHQPVFGSGPGGSRARRAREYPGQLVRTILKAYEASLGQDQPAEIYIVSDDDIIAENYHLENVFQLAEIEAPQNAKTPPNVMAGRPVQ